MKSVHITGLVKRFGETTAVDGISLDVGKGQFVTLLGPSGCGKTTTLNMVAGFETPDDGTIHIGEQLISSNADKIMVPPHKRNLGMVFQSYALWPHMSVAKNVGYGLRMRGVRGAEAEEAIRKALQLVHLEQYAERYPGQLSGGQQQRVAFARAVVYQPDVLLLDEPLSNLDAGLREEMRVELKDLQRETGITTLFVTHDQTEAMTMSDQIVVMSHGRIEQIGSPTEVYDYPANQFVAKFVGTTNLFDATVVEGGNGRPGKVKVADTVMNCAKIDAAKGEPILVSIRPEKMSVSTEKPASNDDDTVLTTKVEKVIYMGASREVWLRLGEHRVRTHGYRLPDVQQGQEIFISITPDSIRVIRE